MGHWILLIAAWQATRGSVYAHVGALSACFMIGLAAGAASSRHLRSPTRHLPVVLATTAALTCVTAAGLPLRLSLPFVPCLLIASGAATGFAFAGIAQLAGGADTRSGSALAFAAEEVGGAFAALVVGLLALPCLGIHTSAAGLALIQLAAIPMAYLRSKDQQPAPCSSDTLHP
jgi:hypothetical protein